MDESKNSLLNSSVERLYNGIVKENPTFVLLLGMCPTLAVTTNAQNGLGMGLTTLVVLAMSNMMISALRKIIPNKVRIPAFIVIIASFVTIVELLLKAYIPSLYDNLGIYIPLIVVNCIILGRAEAYAYKNPVLPSLFDGIGMGMGFTLALTLIGAFRELLGAGELFGFHIMPDEFVPVSIFVMAPGAFFVLALLTAIQNKIKDVGEKNGKDMSKIQSGCGRDCMTCDKECKISLTPSEEVSVESTKESIQPVNAMQEPTEPKKVDTKQTTNVVEESPTNQDEVKISAKKEKTRKAKERKVVKETTPITESEEVMIHTASTSSKNNSLNLENTKAKRLKELSDVLRSDEESVEDEEFELLDLNITKKEKVEQTKPKGSRKKSSIEKAKAMLFKAEETLKEEDND